MEIAFSMLITSMCVLFQFQRWSPHYSWTQIRIEVGTFQEDNVHNFLSAIYLREKSHSKKFRNKYPIVEERDGGMDIIFALVVCKDVWQTTRLLRMIYRANNYYCIHPDAR